MGNGNRKLRSFLFLPAHNKRFIMKALESDADAIILDLEDAVPKSRKNDARENIRLSAESGELKKKTVFVRINHIGTEDFVKDFDFVIHEDIDGLMPSKIESAEDIAFIDRLISFFEIRNGIKEGEIFLAPLIETTKAVDSVNKIAFASRRLVALCLGGEDYLNDLGTVYTYQHSALSFARASLVNAARSNNLLPIDTPYLDISDIKGFTDNMRQAYKNGFAGCLLLNPKQIKSANESFSPDEAMVDNAKQIVEALKEANESGRSGVAMLDGQMIGPPMRKRAENILRQIDF